MPPISLPPNEPVGKALLTSENNVFGGHSTLPKYKIVECGAFCEVIFFYISPKNLLGDFFYSLNEKDQRRAVHESAEGKGYAAASSGSSQPGKTRTPG